MDLSTPPRYNVPVIKKGQPDDSYKFQSLPQPTGSYPFHLDLTKIVTPDDKKMIFHILGDTGDLTNNRNQLKVVDAMATQYHDVRDKPQFLYHLGDIVYNHGEADKYEAQFFKPYAKYPGPIVAIAGNHDSDVNPLAETPYKSLDAFMAVFCDTEPCAISFSNNAARKSITQPNVYWTLKGPLANIIGMHSNVPKYGIVTDEQKAWFIEELKLAGQEQGEKALIVCIHHAPYSADTNHGASLAMIRVLEECFAAANVRPNIVFSGHVHNYQRFSKKNPSGSITPYIVAGGGGYDQLHPIVLVGDEHYTPVEPLLKDVSLENYCDTHHGFLKIVIERRNDGVFLKGEYYMILEDTVNIEPMLADSFEVKIEKMTY
jgi:acid phosphatase type 7